MIIHIGRDYLLDGNDIVHVQDRDVMNQTAFVGKPDENGIILDRKWVCWSRLQDT